MAKGKIGLAITILAIGVVAYFFYFSYKKDAMLEEKMTTTPVQEVLMRNLSSDYPPTPKEVIKYYSEISKCYYNETYTDSDLEKMADQMRLLFDPELLENNPKEQYLKDLKSDIADYATNNYKLSSYSPSASTDVEYFTDNGRECAKMYCNYTIRKGSGFATTKEVFILRKDIDDNHWKIYGFSAVSE